MLCHHGVCSDARSTHSTHSTHSTRSTACSCRPMRAQELDPATEAAVLCHHGVCSYARSTHSTHSTACTAYRPMRAQELDPAKETAVLCHHGVRSMQVATFLAGKGFACVKVRARPDPRPPYARSLQPSCTWSFAPTDLSDPQPVRTGS